MTSYGAAERAFFESEAMPLYEEIAAEGGIASDDERLAPDSPRRRAFDMLVELGLVHLDEDSARWLPDDPTGVQARVVAPLSAEGARLLEESSQWARYVGSLTQAWRASPVAEDRGPFTYLRGGESIGAFISLSLIHI